MPERISIINGPGFGERGTALDLEHIVNSSSFFSLMQIRNNAMLFY